MGTGGAGGGAGQKDAGPSDDAIVCCPYDRFPSPVPSIGHFGGTAYNGRCDAIYDIFCPVNWRVEIDSNGCPFVRADSDPDCPYGPLHGDAHADAIDAD